MLRQAISRMDAACDGAVDLDGMGFNGVDSPFGKKLARMPVWTPRQARAAWKMLRKYTGQLAAYGIEYAAIPEPPAVDNAQQPLAPRRIVFNAEGKCLVVSFPYDGALVSAVKALPRRKFDGATKTWTVPLLASCALGIATMAAENDFDMDEGTQDWLATVSEEAEANAKLSRAHEAEAMSKDVEARLAELRLPLRPFQKAAVAYALRNRRILIGEEQGLGKTIEALATIHAAGAYPAVIVCPASLKFNWEKEARKFLPLSVTVRVLNGKSADVSASIYVLNYDVLGKHIDALIALKPQAVVCDESHYIKSYRARRSELATKLLAVAPMRLLLTGTPVLNRPQELISQIKALGRLDDFGGFWNFASRFCNAHRTQYGWDMSGAANLEELNSTLRRSMYVRHLKSEVLTELPEKQYATVSLPLENRAEYDRAEADVVSWYAEQATRDEEFLASLKGLDKDERKARIRERQDEAEQKAQQAESLVRIEALKQLSARLKMPAVIEWVESFLESGEKLVLFAHHKSIVKELSAHFKAPSITGETPLMNRQAAVDRFQTDPNCKLIVLNIQAGGVGLTLTASSNVAFCEFAWNPGTMDQSSDRVHRIGQRNAVMVTNLVGEETIDEWIIDLIEQKRVVVTAATEGTPMGEQTSVLAELIARLKAKRSES